MDAAEAGAGETGLRDLRFLARRYRRRATATKMAAARTAVHAAARSEVESVERPPLPPAADAAPVLDILANASLQDKVACRFRSRYGEDGSVLC